MGPGPLLQKNSLAYWFLTIRSLQKLNSPHSTMVP
jgi:hypothetical protein